VKRSEARSAHLRAQRFDEARGEALEHVDLTLTPTSST